MKVTISEYEFHVSNTLTLHMHESQNKHERHERSQSHKYVHPFHKHVLTHNHSSHKPSIMALPRHVLDGMQELLHKEPEKLVKTVQSCLDFLTEHGMVTTMKLPPLAVGVHPSNRDGCGVNPRDVHELIDNITAVGWVDAKVAGVAVEIEDS